MPIDNTTSTPDMSSIPLRQLLESRRNTKKLDFEDGNISNTYYNRIVHAEKGLIAISIMEIGLGIVQVRFVSNYSINLSSH